MFRWISLLLFVMLACQVIAKPGANVSLQGEPERHYAAFSQLEENIVFALPRKNLTLEISMKVEGTLGVTSELLNQKLDYDGSGTFTLPLGIQTADDEVAYIGFNVFITDEQGRKQSRALGLRILVGDAQVPGKAQVAEKPSEKRKIKSAPAVETIK